MLHSDLVTLPTSYVFSFQSSWQFKFSLEASWGRKGNLVVCALLTSLLARVGSRRTPGWQPASFLLLPLPPGITPISSRGGRGDGL